MNKYYGLNQVTFGSFFGGPLAATYYLSKNFSSISNAGAKILTVKLGFAISVIEAVIFLLLPRSTDLVMIASFLCATIAFRIAKNRQIGRIVELQNGQCTESGNGNVVVVVICSTIAYMLLVILVWLVFYALGYDIANKTELNFGIY